MGHGRAEEPVALAGVYLRVPAILEKENDVRATKLEVAELFTLAMCLPSTAASATDDIWAMPTGMTTTTRDSTSKLESGWGRPFMRLR